MVRNYKRKTNKQSWTDENMKLAIEEWKKGSAGYRQIGEQFNVPWSTLRDRLKNNNKIITGAKKGFAGGGFEKSSQTNRNRNCVRTSFAWKKFFLD